MLVDFEPRVDIRRDGSAFFRTVFILNKTFPNPVFSFSFPFGAEGPPGAGELILAMCVLSSWSSSSPMGSGLTRHPIKPC